MIRQERMRAVDAALLEYLDNDVRRIVVAYATPGVVENSIPFLQDLYTRVIPRCIWKLKGEAHWEWKIEIKYKKMHQEVVNNNRGKILTKVKEIYNEVVNEGVLPVKEPPCHTQMDVDQAIEIAKRIAILQFGSTMIDLLELPHDHPFAPQMKHTLDNAIQFYCQMWGPGLGQYISSVNVPISEENLAYFSPNCFSVLYLKPIPLLLLSRRDCGLADIEELSQYDMGE